MGVKSPDVCFSQGGLEDGPFVFPAIGFFEFMHPGIKPGQVFLWGFEVGFAVDFQSEYGWVFDGF